MQTLKDYLQQKYAPATAKRYLREIDTFFLSFEKKGIDPKHVQYGELVAYLGERRQSQQNLSPTLQAVKKYYSYLLHTDQRDDHPAQSIQLKDRSCRDVQLQDLFSPQELESLLDRKERYRLLKNRNRLILSLLIYQGLTNGEICRLEVNDFHSEGGTVYIRSSAKTLARTLQLRPKQAQWMRDYLEEDRPKLVRSDTSQLIVSKRGEPERGEGIGYLLETCRHRFPSRRLNAQTIRQSVIANLLRAGNDLRRVQAFAGHKYPSATEAYKQCEVEELKQQVLKFHPLG